MVRYYFIHFNNMEDICISHICISLCFAFDNFVNLPGDNSSILTLKV